MTTGGHRDDLRAVHRVAWLSLVLVMIAACGGSDDDSAVDGTVQGTAVIASTAVDATVAPTVPTSTTSTLAPTTTTSTTSTTTTSSTSTSTTTSTTVAATLPATTAPPVTIPSITAPPITPIDAFAIPVDVETEIGRSVEDRPLTVIRRGTPGGARVLVVGVIHGNEAAGVAIVDQLAVEPVPEGVELWLVRSMNPDGAARSDRQNANLVDLNRNFPENWDVLGEPGFWQYGGPAPASEPETRAMVALGASVRPDVVLWYHQDLFRIAPGSGRSGDIRRRYAEVAGLPIVDITGGTYTGTASQWSRVVLTDGGVGITVELGPSLSEAEIVAHVAAVQAIATEFF